MGGSMKWGVAEGVTGDVTGPCEGEPSSLREEAGGQSYRPVAPFQGISEPSDDTTKGSGPYPKKKGTDIKHTHFLPCTSASW